MFKPSHLFLCLLSFSSNSLHILFPSETLIYENSLEKEIFDPNNLSYDIFGKQKDEWSDTNLINNFILNTKSTLDIYIYELQNDLIKQSILKILKKGIQVRILGEPSPVGNGCDSFSKYHREKNKDCQKSAQFLEKFRTTSKFMKKSAKVNSGIKFFNKNTCRYTNKNFNKTCYQHGKSMIRDNTYTLISTGNFNDSSLCEGSYRENNTCNRDITVITKNRKISMSLKDIFDQDYSYGKSCVSPPENPRPGNVIRKETEGRCQLKDKPLNPNIVNHEINQILKKNKLENHLTINPVSSQTILSLFKKAKDTIYIQAQYLKDPEWQEELLNALGRNVKVYITLASLCHFNQKDGVGFIRYKNLYGNNGYLEKWLNPLFENSNNNLSIKIFLRPIPYEQDGSLGYQHSKVIVIDDKIAWIGSTNGSITSTQINREFGLIMKNKKEIDYLKHIIKEDHLNSFPLDHHVPYLNDQSTLSNLPFGSCKVI